MNPYLKYPRTFHAPWSLGLQNDDKMHHHMSVFEGKEIVVTEKIDGENTNLYGDFVHARSIDSGLNEHAKLKESRAWVKRLHGQIAHNIPKEWRICGENVFARHSIHYLHLETYFYVFGIYNQDNVCLSWDDTEEWSQLLGLKTVPVLYRGLYDESILKSFCEIEMNKRGDPMEGYVVRIRASFPFDQFSDSCFKVVRKNHVQTDQHWLSQALVPNIIFE